MPLGLFTHLTYDASMQAFEPGARLLIVTKGVSEARRGRARFGEERVVEALESSKQESADGVCKAVLNSAHGFEKGRWLQLPRRGPREDMTALAMVRSAKL